MVILNIAPRMWGKTDKCIYYFKLFSLIEFNPILVVLNKSVKESILRNYHLPVFCNRDNIITSHGNSFLLKHHSDILILDEYCFFQVEAKKHIYDLKDRFKNILIWSSFGVERNNRGNYFDFIQNNDAIVFRYNSLDNCFNRISTHCPRINYEDLFEINMGDIVCEMDHGGQIYNGNS